MPIVKLRKPKAENFDMVEYDSGDDDFLHELESMPDMGSQNPKSSMARATERHLRASESSAIYDYTPEEAR